MHEIRMQHPGRNALGSDLMGWLEERLEQAGDAPLLLTGDEDAFCAGLDLRELAGLDRRRMERFLRRIDALAVRLYLHPAPTVAWVNGHAIAGGCVLALCCDARVATTSERARIGLNEIALGACFPPAILRIARSRLPAARVEEVLLGGRLYAPGEALARGLVDELADDDGARARQLLGELAGHPRAGYALTKLALRERVTRVPAEDEARFVELELDRWCSEELRERVRKVLRR